MTWLLRRFPLFVLTVSVMATAVATVREAAGWSDPAHRVGCALAASYLLWLLLESWTTVRSSRATEASTDRGTVYAYGAARAATVVTACLVPTDWSGYRPWMPVLPVAFVCAVALRLAAVRALGRFYSHRVRALGDHRIVDTGPYRLVRHPAYVGMAAAHIAFVGYFLNPASAAALVVLLLPAIVVRVLVEERMLFALPGYSDFAASRRRLIPWVW